MQACQADCDVYQTPTCQAVRAAEADVGELPDRGRTISFMAALTSRISRAASFHTDLQKLDTSAPPRARQLAFSKSQPDLKAAAAVGPPPAGLVVLGKEARRRSRRYVQSEDGTLITAHQPGLCDGPLAIGCNVQMQLLQGSITCLATCGNT